MTELQVSCVFTSREDPADIVRRSFLFFLHKELELADQLPLKGDVKENRQEGQKEGGEAHGAE